MTKHGWCPGRVRRTRAGIVGVVLAAQAALFGGAAAQEITVQVDPRIELFGVLFRLAGRSEYDMTRVPAWSQAVDERMRPYASHPAVRATQSLARQHRVGFFVPMNLAVHLGPVSDHAMRLPADRTTSLHATWTTFPIRPPATWSWCVRSRAMWTSQPSWRTTPS